MPKQFLTINETAELLGFSRDWVYRMINTDATFPARRLGSHWRIDSTKLQDWVDSQPGCGPTKTYRRKSKISRQQYQLNIPPEFKK